MRNITPAALAAIQNQYGEEPITIIEIQWVADGPAAKYADKTVEGVPGKILELGNLDSVLDITRSNTSQAINFAIEDSDGSIKKIIDTRDIHHVPVRVFQYFTGLDIDADRFLVFSGKINAPFSWSEATRTLRFEVLSEIENLEFGFSPEEGEINGLPANLVGQPWPSVFGTAIDVPAVNIGQTVTGSTLCGVGMLAGKQAYLDAPIGGVDCGLGISVAMASAQISHANRCNAAWASTEPEKARQFLDQANSIRAQISQAIGARVRQELCAVTTRRSKLDEAESQGEGCNPLRVLGGEDFPQGKVIQINVGGLLLTGTMNGQDFNIHTRQNAELTQEVEDAERRIQNALCQEPSPAQFYDWTAEVPPGRGNVLNTREIRTHGFVFCNLQSQSKPQETRLLRSKFVEAGARVSIVSGDEIAYIASITPGNVLDVKAYKQFEGERRLVSVPPSYYSVVTQSYGTFDATVVRMGRTLSSRPDEGWGDDVYVTFQSTIGPNPVDIIEYIVNQYTDLTVDITSFAAVKPDVSITPMNFAVLDRPNTLDLVRELAFQARCASYVSEGKVFLKFLPKSPGADEVITPSNVSLGSVEMTTTSIEQLVTKMVATFQLSYAEDEQKIILRNNVSKYGTQEREISFFAYNNAKVVYHVATFWLIRLSNLWKRLRFSGFLDLLRLETFDTVELALPAYVANTNVLGVVNVADYNSLNNEISFEVEVPVLLGTMEAHPLYWPQNSTLQYPTAFDAAPGGGGLGAEASGTLPTGSLVDTPFQGLLPQTVRVGGPNAAFGSRSDRGDRTPGDAGFVPGDVTIASVFANVDNSPAPELDLELEYLDPAEPLQTVESNIGTTVIDIRNTIIADSSNPGSQGRLADFIHGINSDDKLVLDTEALFTDGNQEGTFDFKWDEDDSEWGAGTSFFED